MSDFSLCMCVQIYFSIPQIDTAEAARVPPNKYTLPLNQYHSEDTILHNRGWISSFEASSQIVCSWVKLLIKSQDKSKISNFCFLPMRYVYVKKNTVSFITWKHKEIIDIMCLWKNESQLYTIICGRSIWLFKMLSDIKAFIIFWCRFDSLRNMFKHVLSRPSNH